MPWIIHQAQLIDGHGAVDVIVVGRRYFGHERRIVVVQTAARRPVLDRATLQRADVRGLALEKNGGAVGVNGARGGGGECRWHYSRLALR